MNPHGASASQTMPLDERFRWIGPEEFDDFWAGLWKSPEGREWGSSGSPLSTWLRGSLRARPFFACQPWEPDLQRRHFAQMWGQVFARDYDNPALRDLFWIHELVHWACAPLDPSEDFEAWAAKWDRNELAASMASEIAMHGESPKLTLAALGRAPWAARYHSLGAANPTVPATWTLATEAAAARRLAVRDGLAEPLDDDERWIASFGSANARWRSIWEPLWREVDRGLAAYGRALSMGDLAAARAALETAGSVRDFPEIPYRAQAEAFMAP